jgi:hypothetical protein
MMGISLLASYKVVENNKQKTIHLVNHEDIERCRNKIVSDYSKSDNR